MEAKRDIALKIPQVAPNVIFREGVSSLTILNLKKEDKVYALDGYAMRAFLMINGKISINKIKDKLSKKYKLPEKEFSRDLASFFKWLASKDLITI